MKLRWKIVGGLLVVAALYVYFLLRSDSSERKALDQTRRALRQQGFKTELSEFNLSTSVEMRNRVAALKYVGRIRQPVLMETVGSNAAVVAWKKDRLEAGPGEQLLPALDETLNHDRATLNAACEAALSGPIRFDLDANGGTGMLLTHLAPLKDLIQTLGTRVIVELHAGNKDAAWTNLMALSRLVTDWEPEPAEVSHLVRCAFTEIAFDTVWQALQADGWTEDRLANLQHEWEAVDFLKCLPETAAFSRASWAVMCQTERQQPPYSGMTFKAMLHAPKEAWYDLRDRWERSRYRRHGSYDDERALMLYYMDREVQLQKAVQSPTWSEMRVLPGATNPVRFMSKHPSRMQAMMNLKMLNLAFTGRGRSLLGAAAEAEAQRRLIITGIALERYRGQHGSYPASLEELGPGLLKNPPVDFMDGKLLRYHRTDDGRFVLYSVGLDCVDNGGNMQRSAQPGPPFAGVSDFGIQPGTDLVWPRPASTADVENFRREQIKAEAERTDRDEEREAAGEWERTASRQAKVESILAAKPEAKATEPSYHGRALNEVLRNEAFSGTNKLALQKMLALEQVVTGEEPELVTFEVPVNYEVLTNLGSLLLLIDPTAEENSDEGCQVGELECNRAPNGNCRLVWHTIFDAPGKHALQANLLLHEPSRIDQDISGPLSPFVSTNLGQFSLTSATFNPKYGATLRAKLPEPEGIYSVELRSTAGELLKTIKGTTSNGVIKVHWDLIDDRGRACTNESFDSIFHITLPGSGRSQTLKGP